MISQVGGEFVEFDVAVAEEHVFAALAFVVMPHVFGIVIGAVAPMNRAGHAPFFEIG